MGRSLEAKYIILERPMCNFQVKHNKLVLFRNGIT